MISRPLLLLPRSRSSDRHDSFFLLARRCCHYASRLRRCTDLAQVEELQAELLRLDGSDRGTFVGNHLVQMFGKLGRLDQAWQAFARIRQPNVFSWNAILAAAVRHGDLQRARGVFDRMPERDVVSWTALIAGSSQSGDPELAVEMFSRMQAQGVVPDRAAFLSALDAISLAQALESGISVHGSIARLGLESDALIGSALINMYGKCQDVAHAKVVFDSMERRNVVAWTAIVAANAQNGRVLDAKFLFEKMPQQDIVSWNSMISGMGKNQYNREALDLFNAMEAIAMLPEKSTLVSAIDACANLPSLAEGRRIHSRIDETTLESDREIQNALVNMYGRCGDLETARALFDRMRDKNVISWTSVIAAYAHHGHSRAALELFYEMACEGQAPNEITLATLLYACNYTGRINDGVYYFMFLHLEFGIPATREHFVWLIDVLGRCGQLEKAEELLRSMPFEPQPLAWRMLLGACQSHKDVERGERLARHLFATNSVRSSPYVVLSNIFLSSSAS
ncbi:pentatricopeptide repeat-containing protein At2g21090 [Selaginella moellendorffii]|nr:pentatricopeptide repeat-containing protein At2g21090 [Selaginella moellendorffii]|eukprot:XP_024535241.1 pentatricopeptide repeat-containing protein At2g21090 [Selaginella moellendorffii]